MDDNPAVWWYCWSSDLGLGVPARYDNRGVSPITIYANLESLDVIKTRVQTQSIPRPPASILSGEQSEMLPSQNPGRLSTIQIARQAYREEGLSVFFRGLGVCSFRAFFVNAVQWAVYEWMMHILLPSKAGLIPDKQDQTTL